MLKRINKYIFSNERGMALAMVLITSTLLAMVGGSFLASTTQESGIVADRLEDIQALYTAESGIQYARNRLRTWTEWQADWSKTLDTGGGRQATVNFVSATKTITSDSDIDGHAKQISLTVTPVKDSPFTKGGCGCSSISFGNNATTDSYVYSGTTYTPSTLGDVGSNGDVNIAKATIAGNVIAGDELSGHADGYITGDVTTGGSSSLNAGQIGGTALVNIDPDPTPCDCSAIDVATMASEASGSNNNNSLLSTGFLTGSSFEVPASESDTVINLAAGTYYFTNFDVDNNVTINVSTTDQVIIVLDGPMSLKNNVTFNIIIDGEGAEDYSNANNLRVYSNSSSAIVMENNVKFSGAVYAPYADVTLKQNTEAYGALLGNNTNINNNAELHYSSDLNDEVEMHDNVTTVTVQNGTWAQEI